MKLRPLNLTHGQISKHEVVHESEKTRHDVYVHPWYKFLKKPNPPTPEAIEKAKFKDKTFTWNGR